MKWIIGAFLTIAICLSGGVVYAQTCTTTKDMPLCIVADPNGITSNSLSFSVTVDIKADPYVDKLTVVVSSTEVVGMAGGSFVQELLSINPKDGRVGISGKKKYSLLASSLVPGKKYTVTATSFLGVTETHKKIVTFTTKGTTTSPAGTNTTPAGVGQKNGITTDTTKPANQIASTTRTKASGLVPCSGTGYEPLFDEFGKPVLDKDGNQEYEYNEKERCGFQNLLNLIQRGIAFVIRLILPIAAIILAYTGFLFMTSGGNEEVRARAKSILTKTLIGIALILCSVLIVNLLYKAFGVNPCYNWLGKSIEECKTSQ